MSKDLAVTSSVETMLVDTNIMLDKNDIVAISVAEAEKRIKAKVSECKAGADRCTEMMNTLYKQYQEHTKKFLESKSDKQFQLIKSGIASLQLGLSTEISFSHGGIQDLKSKDQESNRYVIVITDTQNHRGLTVQTKSFLTTKMQLDLAEKYKSAQDLKQGFVDQGVAWKYKLSDIAMLERQMRAQVARHEMNKTAAGRNIVDAMLDTLDQTIELIGS